MIKMIFLAMSLISFVLYRAEKLHPVSPEKWKDISSISKAKNDTLKISGISLAKQAGNIDRLFPINKPISGSMGLFYDIAINSAKQ